MKTIAAIRTNRWGEAEERLAASLREAFGTDVAVVFHNRPKHVQLELETIDINRAWVEDAGLRVVPDWGWRCGDYFYYALRDAKPEYDYYWLIEPDVLFTGSAAEFFGRFDDADHDILALDPRPFDKQGHLFADTLEHLKLWKAIFALTRMSGRALDRLLTLRQENCAVPVRPRRFANDELFVFSNAHADPGLSIGNLRDLAATWFDGAYFQSDPDLIEQPILADEALRNKLFHPVRSLEDYKRSLASRIARTGFLNRSGESLSNLSDEDLKDVVAYAGHKVLSKMRRVKANYENAQKES